MSYWNGHLRNGVGDIVLDTLLSISVVAAYVPQISLMYRHHSSQGISPYFLLFNTISSTSQLSYALLFATYALPTAAKSVLKLIAEGSLQGAAALGCVLGVVQIALQWACSMILLLLYAKLETHDELTGTRSQSFLARRSIAASAFVHAAIFLGPSIALAFPQPSPHQFGSGIFVGFTYMMDTWSTPIFLTVQFYAQYLEMRKVADHGAFSLVSLGLQLVVMLLVAGRWLQRLGVPTWRPQSAPVWLWYQWGFLPFSYIMYVIGSAVLLAMSIWISQREGQECLAKESAPLLA